jgi:hypothetical protein
MRHTKHKGGCTPRTPEQVVADMRRKADEYKPSESNTFGTMGTLTGMSIGGVEGAIIGNILGNLLDD